MSALRKVGSWANDQESSEGEGEDEEFGVDCDSAAPTKTVQVPNEVCMYIEEVWSWSLALVVAVTFCNRDHNTHSFCFVCLSVCLSVCYPIELPLGSRV